MGTMLFAAGLQSGDPPEVWNLSHPDLVRRIHRGYIDAGSRVVLTNTFGGNRLRLMLHRLEDRVDNLNRTAAIIARAEVTASGTDALVAGDIGPSGEIMAPLGTLDRDTAIDVFAEQAAALVAGGADLIWVETMSDLAEIEAAIAGVRRAAPATPIVATMTFDTRGHTMMGVSPEQAAEALAALQVDAIGGNCGNGPDELLPVVARMAAVSPGIPHRGQVERRHAGLRRRARGLPHGAGRDGEGGAGDASGRCDSDRRVLWQHPGPPRRDARGPAARDLTETQRGRPARSGLGRPRSRAGSLSAG